MVNAIVIIYFRNFGEIMRFVSIVVSLLTFLCFSNGELKKNKHTIKFDSLVDRLLSNRVCAILPNPVQNCGKICRQNLSHGLIAKMKHR